MATPEVVTQLLAELATQTDAERAELRRALGIKEMVHKSMAWYLRSPEFAERVARVVAQVVREWRSREEGQFPGDGGESADPGP